MSSQLKIRGDCNVNFRLPTDYPIWLEIDQPGNKYRPKPTAAREKLV
jgi:hypothetical protein